MWGAININIIRKIVCCALTAALCINFCGCSSEPKPNKVFKFDISANPGTLDPQQANDSISNMIIENVFAGLMSINSDGSVSKAAAKEYTVSEDGLVYNFTLRDDIYWVSVDDFEAQCTAKDFVYGFKRLFSPETKSPRASDYYCIKNSEAVSNGVNTQLGVRAVSDFELEITLTSPNPRFAAMLAEPPAMPCSEEFFIRSQGKYGLSAKCTPSNGAFYVRTWNYSPYNSDDVNYLTLSRNSKNAEALDVKPSGLNFFIVDESKFYSDFTDDVTDCLVVSNDDKRPAADEFNCDEFCNITCGLIFNNTFQLFRSTDFRRALASLADRDTIASAIPGSDIARGVVPERVAVPDGIYREITGGCELLGYDPEKARELFQSVRSSLDTSKFSGARVIVRSSTANTAVSYILQEWQREFGFYCSIEELDEQEFVQRLQSGDYEAAVVELSGKYNSPAAFLEQFKYISSENYSRFSNYKFEKLLNKANEASNAEDSTRLYFEAEQMLIDEAGFVPLFYKKEFFYTSEDSVGVIYNPFSKTVNFIKAMM